MLRYPASIDRPGKGQDRTVPSLSTRDRFSREEVVHTLATFEPYLTLPRVLLPNMRAALAPPVMHYGWLATEDILQQHARTHAPGRAVLFSSIIAELLLRRGHNREDSEDGNKEFEEEEEDKENTNPMKERMMKVTQMQNSLVGICRETGMTYPAGLIKLVPCFSISGIEVTIVSLYTNYDLHRVPSDEFIEALERRIGTTTPPRWYLDGVMWRWRPREGRYSEDESRELDADETVTLVGSEGEEDEMSE